jgi:hypothetical protein
MSRKRTDKPIAGNSVQRKARRDALREINQAIGKLPGAKGRELARRIRAMRRV